MSAVDERGRLFGRLNVVDAAVGAILLLLIPLAYGTYLLFRPAAPHISNVAPSIITKEEQRISAGGMLVAKFKVKGDGFTPLLRARIGEADALGFVFENPNSADVLVGPLPPGPHDLILFDGVQEVARAAGVISLQATTSVSIRAIGWITNLDQELADAIRVGTSLPAELPLYKVIALGPLQSGYRPISLSGSTIEIPTANAHARPAVIELRCEPSHGDNPCTMGDRSEGRTPVTMTLPGPGRAFNFSIDELVPAAAPVKATLRIQQQGASAATVRAGDRDAFLDERAATAVSVSGNTITLEAGLDRDHRGWRYRGQRLVPGAPFVFATDRYEVSGIVQSIDVKAAQP